MMHKAFAVAAIVSFTAFFWFCESFASAYYVAPGRISAELRVTGDGQPDLMGQFHNATGSFDFDDIGHAVSRVRIALDGDSLEASNYGNQRMLAMMVEPELFPEITFVSTSRVALTDDKGELKGVLTLHGVTKPVTAQAMVSGETSARQRGGGVVLSLKIEVKRAEFGINDDFDEDRKFGHTLVLSLNTQGVRQ